MLLWRISWASKWTVCLHSRLCKLYVLFERIRPRIKEALKFVSYCIIQDSETWVRKWIFCFLTQIGACWCGSGIYTKSMEPWCITARTRKSRKHDTTEDETWGLTGKIQSLYLMYWKYVYVPQNLAMYFIVHIKAEKSLFSFYISRKFSHEGRWLHDNQWLIS